MEADDLFLYHDDDGARVAGWLGLALVAALTALAGWAVWRWVR
jgi:hypothetical protein